MSNATTEYERADAARETVFTDIRAERARQDNLCENPLNRLKGWRKFSEEDSSDLYKLAILMEEVGEIGTEILNGAKNKEMEEELVQVAAVAVAWVEALRQ